MNHTHLTLEEQERAAYMDGDTRTAELLARVDELDEQSEFRRALIEDIENLCEQAKGARFEETRELAASILRLIENSYVEL